MLRVFEFALESEERGSRLLAEKLIGSSLSNPLYLKWAHDAGPLFGVLHRHRLDEFRDQLAARLRRDPNDAPELLWVFCGTVYGAGARHKSEFGLSQYETLGEYVDPQAVAEAITKAFGEVDAPTARYFDDSLTKEDRVVREFLYQHNQAVAGDTALGVNEVGPK